MDPIIEPTYKKLTPFKRCVLQNFPFIEQDFDSLTNYGLLCKIVEYLNNVISSQNQVINNITALNNAFIELKDYIDNYFDNLDVQEEINNKIDEMVESGELQRILNNPATSENIGGVIIGDGINVEADGTISVKAGEGITVDEDGVSITTFENYIDAPTLTYDYVNSEDGTSSHIYYSIIPSAYKPKIVMADTTDPNIRKVPSDFDFKYKPSMMINAAPWNTSTGDAYGVLIVDGNVEVENNMEGGDVLHTLLTIDDNGRLESVNGNTSASDITTPYCCRAWHTLIDNAEDVTGTAGVGTTKEPRSFIAQSEDGSYLIGCCGGRTFNDTGMQVQDIADFLINRINFNPRVAFNLDGGGSSAYLYRGIRQNPLIALENRKCPNYIVFSSDEAKANGVFEAQSATNAGLIDNYKKNTTAWLGYAGLTERKHDDITVQRGGVRTLDGMLTTIEVNFTVDNALSAGSRLFINLPNSALNSDLYFTAVKRDGSSDSSNLVRQCYIKNTESYGTAIYNRFAWSTGDYSLLLTYMTQP